MLRRHDIDWPFLHFIFLYKIISVLIKYCYNVGHIGVVHPDVRLPTSDRRGTRLVKKNQRHQTKKIIIKTSNLQK